MADAKKVVTLMNRSKRNFDTINAEGKAIRHEPGRTEEYTLEQAAQFDPREMTDLSKLPGSVDKEDLRKENVALKAENAALKAQVAALTPTPAAPVAEAAPEPEPEVVAETAPEPEVVSEAEPQGEGGRRKRK